MKRKIGLAMKYFILSLILFQGLGSADEAGELAACESVAKEECEKAKQRYWWGEQFEEIDAQITTIAIAMRNAVLSDDYTDMSQYMDFPVSFEEVFYRPSVGYEQVFRGFDDYMEGIEDNLRYAFIENRGISKQSHNLEDPKKDFFRILRGSRFSHFKHGVSMIVDELTLDDGDNDYSIWLYELNTIISLKILCKNLYSMPEKEFLRLPEERSLCLSPKILIRDILVEFFI